MKKALSIFMWLMLACTQAGLMAYSYFAADDTLPAGAKNVNNTFYRSTTGPTAGGIYVDQGPGFGTTRLAKYNDLVGAGGASSALKSDANGNYNFDELIIAKGGAGKSGRLVEKTPNGSWYWKHTDDDGSTLATLVTVTYDANGNSTVTFP
jgi:hypothetical protein